MTLTLQENFFSKAGISASKSPESRVDVVDAKVNLEGSPAKSGKVRRRRVKKKMTFLMEPPRGSCVDLPSRGGGEGTHPVGGSRPLSAASLFRRPPSGFRSLR